MEITFDIAVRIMKTSANVNSASQWLIGLRCAYILLHISCWGWGRRSCRSSVSSSGYTFDFVLKGMFAWMLKKDKTSRNGGFVAFKLCNIKLKLAASQHTRIGYLEFHGWRWSENCEESSRRNCITFAPCNLCIYITLHNIYIFGVWTKAYVVIILT